MVRGRAMSADYKPEPGRRVVRISPEFLAGWIGTGSRACIAETRIEDLAIVDVRRSDVLIGAPVFELLVESMAWADCIGAGFDEAAQWLPTYRTLADDESARALLAETIRARDAAQITANDVMGRLIAKGFELDKALNAARDLSARVDQLLDERARSVASAAAVQAAAVAAEPVFRVKQVDVEMGPGELDHRTTVVAVTDAVVVLSSGGAVRIVPVER